MDCLLTVLSTNTVWAQLLTQPCPSLTMLKVCKSAHFHIWDVCRILSYMSQTVIRSLNCSGFLPSSLRQLAGIANKMFTNYRTNGSKFSGKPIKTLSISTCYASNAHPSYLTNIALHQQMPRTKTVLRPRTFSVAGKFNT